jgi:hypothetical protein
MYRAIGIRERGSDKISFKILHDIDNEVLAFLKIEQR